MSHDDPKRTAIADKFFHLLSGSGGEQPSDTSLSTPELVRRFSSELENAVWESTGAEHNRDYKARIFTLTFNLGDKRNASLRERILRGEFTPESLANADADAIASDQVRQQRQEQREKYFSTQVVKHAAEDESSDIAEGNASQVDQKVDIVEATTELPLPSISLPPVPKRVRYEHEPSEDVPSVETNRAEHVEVRNLDKLQINPEARTHALNNLLEYIEKLKQKLAAIDYAPLRTHSEMSTKKISFLTMFFTNWDNPSVPSQPVSTENTNLWGAPTNGGDSDDHGRNWNIQESESQKPAVDFPYQWREEDGNLSDDWRPACKFFARGTCTAGNGCKFRHVWSTPSDNDKRLCEICSEDIILKGSKYGLLENCDHVFCLNCIREWRNQKEKQDRLNLRKCPICRIDSFLIIPSSEYATSERKYQELEAYKRTLGVIPCKKFNKGDGSCPFGDSCMYLHEKPDGSRFMHDFKIMQGVDGKKTKKCSTLSDFIIK